MTRAHRVALALSLALGVAVTARAAPPPVTASYHARYAVSRAGMALGEAHFQLSDAGPRNCYVYSGQATPNAFASLFVGRIEQESRFCVVDGHIRPQWYRHRQAGKPRDSYTLTFDWADHVIRYVDAAGRHRHFALKPGTQDPMSLQVAARRWLAGQHQAKVAGARHRFRVADDNGIHDYQLRVSAGGVIDTPAGHFDTVKVERVGHADQNLVFWLARDADWIPIRVEHRGGTRYRFSLKALTRPAPPQKSQ